jgi:hypothetical protein
MLGIMRKKNEETAAAAVSSLLSPDRTRMTSPKARRNADDDALQSWLHKSPLHDNSNTQSKRDEIDPRPIRFANIRRLDNAAMELWFRAVAGCGGAC